MVRLLLIAPYSGMGEMAKKMKLPTGIQLDIKVANLEEGLKAALLAEKQGYDLIISRGGTATMIEKVVSLPVIHIGITGYDMLRVFTLVREIKKAALVGYANISEGAATICNILEFDVKVITIENENEVKNHLFALKEEGFSVVIGDVITVQVAEQVGLRGVLITSGREALWDALEESKRIYNLLNKVRTHYNTFQESFMSQPYPLVIVKNNTIWKKNTAFELKINDERFIESLDVLELNQRVLQQEESHWTKVDIGKYSYEIEAFLVNKSLQATGLIFYPLQSSNEIDAISINNTLIHQPLIGESVFAQRVRDKLHQFAFADGIVSIIGEQGTGKRTIVQAMHFERFGYEAPFINLDGRFLATSTMEVAKRKLQKIHKGTLMVRYIETLSTPLQTELLALIKNVPNEMKVIACLDEGVHGLLTDGSFDGELYNILMQNPFHLVPLRERKEDIGIFINYFLAEFHENLGNETLGIKQEAINYMMQFDWTGNITQLKQVVKELSMTSKGNFVELNQVKELMMRYTEKPSTSKGASLPFMQGTLKEIEQQIIRQVLHEEGNNQSKAANRLGINRSTLWRKLK